MTRQTVIVTGAAGFVGSGVIEALARLEDLKVVAVDRQDRPTHLPDNTTYIRGDLADEATLRSLAEVRCDALIHLASVPGGAAEEDPARGKRINVDASMALVDAVSEGRAPPRIVFASSIAVFDAAAHDRIDQDTPVSPTMLYGAHKAMMETWLATLSRRERIDAVSLRLPGIVARPPAPSGLKSAFLSNLFHDIPAGNPLTIPVSAEATTWLMSRSRVVRNILHALAVDTRSLTADRSVILPALRCRISDLVDAIARNRGCRSDGVSYRPEETVEAVFGRYPNLDSSHAEALGFRGDIDIASLVGAVYSDLQQQGSSA